jgi:hypothetical protein
MRKCKPTAKPEFTGELATPISYRPPAHPSGAVLDLFPDVQAKWKRERGKAMADAVRQMLRKLPLLAAHYGISGDDMNANALPLLLCVCRDFIPGFQVREAIPSRRGRPTKRSKITTRMQFIADVQAIKAENNLKSDRDALWALIKTNARYREGGVPRSEGTIKKAIDALETRYSEAKRDGLKTFASVIEQICKAGDRQGLANLFDATENH